jgi:hypothetical protein
MGWDKIERSWNELKGEVRGQWSKLTDEDVELIKGKYTELLEEAAAPQSSLAFMFWGEGLFVFPLMLFYTAISYSVFRGKIRPVPENY